MTAADWTEVVGLWIGCWTTGFVAGHVHRWYQALSEKL